MPEYNDLIGLVRQIVVLHVRHVRHALKYNFLTSSAKWQREITKFEVLTTK